MSEPLYTVSRCRMTTDEIYGPTHGSMDGNTTSCGIHMSCGAWWVCSNGFDAMPTCKKCLKIHDEDRDNARS